MTPPAAFADLASTPIPVLSAILAAMEAYRETWRIVRSRYVASAPSWEAQHGVEYDRDFAVYEAEIERFREGLRLIETDSDVLLAFRLTNEAFRTGTKESWRLFQIVFLVTQLGSIAALGNHPEFATQREDVDIVYFPTGGGKTEAYLAVLVFHCFYDRLRGKTAGVTAWTRFPLRLLTLQQTQRVADVIGAAEIVRRGQTDPRLSGVNVDGFGVGYFVGEGGSPNELADPSKVSNLKVEIQVAWAKATDAIARQEWKRVVRCPSCKTANVTVELDSDIVRLFHKCGEPGCAFPNGVIPVFIVDNEIYRYLPSVIVGTIDKLASIGNQRKVSQIFGSIDGKCTRHGYYKAKCCQKDCMDPSLLQPGIPPGLSGPTLFVQDELHLLKEGLGTFDGHYETFTQQLLRELGQTPPLKVIASSATIEAFQRQVSHLYGRAPERARVFPGLGPTQGESFYASTQSYPQRIYVGVIPHNKTIFNTILELIEFYHAEVERLLRLTVADPNPYGGALRPASPEWVLLIDFYRTSLTYFLQKREVDSIRTDIEGDVNPKLIKAGFQPLTIRELTGSTTTNDVQTSLETLERPASSTSAPDAVLATSMVSHGVDIDRFNAMIFDGMPRQNAEYIQASSRVGRAHVGIVITCLHPARERDQSHYSYFTKFHEFLGQLVEPVAINRWAKFSIDRTLPGLFMGVLLQLIAPQSGTPDRYYILDFVKRQVSAGSLRADNFALILERAYFLGQADPSVRQLFQDEIRTGVQRFLDQIITAGPDSTFVSDVLIPKPLRSLRDVDEPIDIELDSDGSVWGAASSQQGGANGPTND
ncbi:MAG: helicase-related protein [Candidatus Sulfotelmatobacter sp.]